MNSRLDTMQAAILLEKLAIYADELEARNCVAARYTAALDEWFQTPVVPAGYRSIWAQYTLQARDEDARDAAIAQLKQAGIPSAVYYSRPLHLQTAYESFPIDPEGLPASEATASRVFSLPMHPYLSIEDQDKVITALSQ